MKKNGFTLIELIGIVTLMAIISLIVFPALLNVTQTSEKNKKEIAVASANRQAFFASSLITTFARETTVALKDTGSFSSDWTYSIDRRPSKLFSCGKIRVPVRTESKSLLEGLKKAITPDVKAVILQRSKGYDWRTTLSCEELGEAISFIKSIKEDAVCIVDNC